MTDFEIEQKIIDNKNLVRFVVNEFFPAYFEDEDILQAGLIGLWKACVSYDESRAKFSTYAVRCIKTEIMREIRRNEKENKKGKMISLNEYIPKNNDGEEDLTRMDCLIDDTDSYSTSDYDLSVLRKRLSKRDYNLLKLYIQEYSMTEIAGILGITKQRVSEILKSIQAIARRKLAPS